MRLRPYQQEALEAIRDAYAAGCTRQLVVLPTASGKSCIFSHLGHFVDVPPGKTVWLLVHRNELVNQAAKHFKRNNPSLRVEIERADHVADPSCDVIVGSVQSLGTSGEGFTKRIERFDRDRAFAVAIDECFPAGTMIGDSTIESLRVGDTVIGYDHAAKVEVRKGVIRTFKSNPTGMVRLWLSNGQQLACTPNHPIYSPATEEYVPAANTVMHDIMVYTDRHGRRSSNEGLRLLREADSTEAIGNASRKSEEDLLLACVSEGFSSEAVLRNYGQNESKVRLRPHETAKPNADSGVQGEGYDNAEDYGVEATGSWWKRDAIASAATVIGWGSRVEYGGRGTDPCREIVRLSNGLQIGYSQHHIEVGDRGGWTFPQSDFQEGSGPEEGSPTEVVRVDRVEILEPTSDGTFGGVCPGGFVYNVEVEGVHNYFANGVLVHNCHHAISPQYLNIFKYFRVLKGDSEEDKGRLLLGVTATPKRTDKIGLETIVDKIVFERGIREMISDKWLADIHAFRVETEVDLDGVKMRHGDFATGDLETRVNTDKRNRLIVKTYQARAEGKSGLAFTVDVRHSHDLASEFRRAGIMALPFSGETPEFERERLLERHQSGEVRILVSCQALGEGTDLPWAQVGLMCRPTKSALLFTQQVGRLLRPFPAPEEGPSQKPFALILDFVDNSAKHQICSTPTLMGLRADFNLDGGSLTQAVEEIDQAQDKVRQLRLDTFKDLRSMRAILQSVDLLKPPMVPAIIKPLSRLVWVEGAEGVYQIIGKATHLSVRMNTLGQWEIFRHESGLRKYIETQDSLANAISIADNLVPRDEIGILNADADWRKKEPTEKQVYRLAQLDPGLVRRYGQGDMGLFLEVILSTKSRGDVSDMINERSPRSQQ